MKKIIVLLTCILLLSAYSRIVVRADEDYCDSPNWGVPQINQNEQNIGEFSSAESVWDEERDENIYENYGSNKSPTFLSRENIEPDDDDSVDSEMYDPD